MIGLEESTTAGVKPVPQRIERRKRSLGVTISEQHLDSHNLASRAENVDHATLAIAVSGLGELDQFGTLGVEQAIARNVEREMPHPMAAETNGSVHPFAVDFVIRADLTQRSMHVAESYRSFIGDDEAHVVAQGPSASFA